MRGEEGEGAGGREGDTRRDAASAKMAAVRRRVSAEPSMEARGTPEAELKREMEAWMEGREEGEGAGVNAVSTRMEGISGAFSTANPACST